MSTKITNNLKVHGESTTQKYTDAQYNTDTKRINGAQPRTPISSKLVNTGLRNATLVTSAFIEALKTIVLNNNDLTTAITVGTDTTYAALVTALTEALVKIKVETAVLADNVKSGAIVEETTTARESKQGFGISLGLNSKLQFKTTWLGTHKNNDILYYSAAGALKGFYIVKGLSVETASQTAGTLTITSGQTPTTHAANLQRLTFETAISVDTGLSKTDIINSSSTTNQMPSAKAVFDVVDTKVDKVTNYSLSKNDFTDRLKNKLDGIAEGAQVNPTAATIKSQYESNNDTNAFSDAEKAKLAGIAEGAQVNVVDEPIAVLNNNGTIAYTTLALYKQIRLTLRKRTNVVYDGTFYGDGKVVSPNIFYHAISHTPKTWVGSEFSPAESFVIDIEYNGSAADFATYLNSKHPAANYASNVCAKGTRTSSPFTSVYAQVEGAGSINQYGGVRLEQYNGSTATYATFRRVDSTNVRINCDSTYELEIRGTK